ncbi:hypothetical protein AB3Z07_04975 [Metabacillus halosaccharovorans]|uniref:hypothetical protein n=1 Tax=Metabacillus halosaccharovorans TaxID=930124 RepID=UPI0034CF5CCE
MTLLNLKVNHDQKSILLQQLVDTAFSTSEKYINLIAFTIKKEIKSSDPQTVIETYSDYIVSKIFESFSKEQILSYISSGFLFETRLLVIDKLYNHEVVKEAIEYKEAVPV